MREWLRHARDGGYLAAGILVVCLVFILTALPLWARVPVAVAAGAALFGEMRWERRSERNRRRADRVVAATTGWWVSGLGVLAVLAGLLVIPAWGTVAFLLVCGVILFVAGLSSLVAAVEAWIRRSG